MQARGYDGTIRFANERAMIRTDWLLLAGALTLLGGLILYARL
jgi:energy-coupling factor transporter transmembrane protein EcfT